MSESLSASLDKLSKSHVDVISSRKILTEKFLEDWPSKSQELCSQFKELESSDEREKWLKETFTEIFDVLHSSQQPGNLSMPQISKFIEDIVSGGSNGVSNNELSSVVGKMFISVSNQFPEGDDNKLIALARITNSLHKELFKFSRISTKLLNGEQTVFLRHLLKKSKYELKKFNLLAECSTGYSQLIVLLLTAYYDPDNLQRIPYYIQQLCHLIGKYSLDSMRCLELILAISCDFITSHHKFLIELLKLSDYWPKNHPADNFHWEKLNYGGNMVASNIIAFHLSHSDADNDTNYMDMVCMLVKNEFVNALSIWENIAPNNEALEKFFQKFDNDLEQESMKGIANPLAMAAALTAGDEDDGNDDVKMGKGLENVTDKEASRVDDERKDEESAAKEDEKLRYDVLNKGKLKFLQRLLIHGCIIPAFHVLKIYPKLIYIDESIPKLIARAFDHIISPLYESMVFSPSADFRSCLLITRLENGLISHKTRLLEEIKSHDPFLPLELRTRFAFYYPEWSENLSPVESVEELFQKSHEYLSILGPCIAKSFCLITKLCRVGVADIASTPSAVDKWIDYARKFIFPAIPVLGMNPVITTDIYELIKLFPFEKRYFMYNEMITKLNQDVLTIKVGFNKAEREAKSILKALSIDTISVESRRLAKLVSTNPLATLIPTVKQIENYDKVSELVVITTKYFNDFAYDVLQYVLLLRLTHGRAAVQSDGVNQTMWVQRLSIFIAGLAKNCRNMDITNIIVYIVKTLHSGNIIAVSILRELIAIVGGIKDLNEVNVKQLLMLNSGKPLKQVARRLMFDSRDDNFELASNLIDLFAKQNAVSEVILLLYSLNLKANTQDAHYKILSTRCDEMNTLLWSFIELVKHCFDSKSFAENVLPLDVLTNEYHVSTPWVFHIWRDYIDERNGDEDESANEMLERATFEGVDFTSISKDFFITFWKLSLFDVQFDKSLYDERKRGLEEELSTIHSARRKNDLSNQIKDILISCISHQKTFNRTKQALGEQSITWTEDLSDQKIMSVLQYCIVPRILFSPPDAIYTSSFILLTFDTSYLMKIFEVFVRSKVLSTLLFCCTSSEAGNMGIFFTQLLGSLEEMRQNGQLGLSYHRELHDLHTIITHQLVNTLCNNNYMSIRNGIEFMKHVSNVFPVVDAHIELVCHTLAENLMDEGREDIRLPSNALLGHLKARLKNAMRLEQFCELTSEEKEEMATLKAELFEIKQYENQLVNEKKQIELRLQLELNKKQREKAELTKDKQEEGKIAIENKPVSFSAIPTGPSANRLTTLTQAPSLPFGKVVRLMDEVCNNLKNNNLNRALDCIKDQSETQNIRNLMKRRIPIRDFRSSLFEILEHFFCSLVRYPNNAEFVRKLETLKASVEHVMNDAAKKRADMYSDTTNIVEPSKKLSRYNGQSAARAESIQISHSKAVETKGAVSTEEAADVLKSSSNDERHSIRSDLTSIHNSADVEKNGSDPTTKTKKIEVNDLEISLAKEKEQQVSENRTLENEKRTSYTNRRNRNTLFDRSNDFETRNKGPKDSKDVKRVPPMPSAPRALVFPDRPSQSRPDNRNSRNSPSSYQSRVQGGKELKRHVTPEANEERSTKRYRVDDNRSNFRTLENRSTRDVRKDSDRSRFGDRKNQVLPQGPKGSGEYSSRYQR